MLMLAVVSRVAVFGAVVSSFSSLRRMIMTELGMGMRLVAVPLLVPVTGSALLLVLRKRKLASLGHSLFVIKVVEKIKTWTWLAAGGAVRACCSCSTYNYLTLTLTAGYY
jgi:hypothetical protein